MRVELLALALVACSTAPVPCPDGTHADEGRAAAIAERLGTVSEGRALLALRDRVRAICFGDRTSASVITSEHVVVLNDALEEAEAAARLGHLLVHVRDGLPIDVVSSGLDPAACDAAVDRALTLEARAYVVEVSLQDALGAHPTLLAFELAGDLRAASPDARESIALRYLRAHPSGAPGIDGLADAYRARCR
jgi:hypothetical protein